jgi:hypothetical protein
MPARYSGVASDSSGFWEASSSSISFGERGGDDIGDDIKGKSREKLGAKEGELSALDILSPT